MAIDGTGEDDAGNRRDGRGLSGAAHWPIAAHWRGRIPDFHAVSEPQRKQPAPDHWIERGHSDHDGTAGSLERLIRQRHVRLPSVGGRSPLDTAEHAALADTRAPQHLAGVRVETVHDTRFLTDDETPLA